MSGLVPKLRFREFKDQWCRTTLGKESTCLDNKRIPIKEGDRSKMAGTYPYYGASGIIDYIDQYIFDESLVLLAEDGANIINRSTPIAFIASGKYWVNNHAHVYRAKGSTLFLATYLENLRYDNYNTGTAQPKLNGAVCNSLPLNFPSLPEQQKIADFLSSVDAKIDAVKRKLNAFERYKKGLMQQIFAQKIRFKQDDGSKFPEWEEKRLGDVASVYQPETISQSQLQDTGYLTYGANGIIGRYHSYNHEDEQVTITCRGNTCGTVGYTEKFSWITGNAMVINNAGYEDINKKFLYFYLSQIDFSPYITGSGQPQITGVIKKLPISLATLPEQQKIADFLSSVDAKIDAIKRQIEKLEAFKKGLLQQMFV